MPGLITVGEKSVPFFGDISLAFKQTYSLDVDRGDLYDIGFRHEEVKGKEVLIAIDSPSKIRMVEVDNRFLDCFVHWEDHTSVIAVLDLFLGVNRALGTGNSTLVLNQILEVLVKAGLMESSFGGKYRRTPK